MKTLSARVDWPTAEAPSISFVPEGPVVWVLAAGGDPIEFWAAQFSDLIAQISAAMVEGPTPPGTPPGAPTS